jgi:hypothetical protein
MIIPCHRSILLTVVFLATAAMAAEVNLTCTGKVSDTALLNNGITSSHFGDDIRIHGQCLVNGTIVLAGDRTYEGDSRTGTIIRQAAGSNLTALLASDSWASDSAYTGDPIRIAHLTLDGNRNTNSGTSALVIRSWLTTIEDLQIEYAPEDGLQITNLSKNKVSLKNSQVNGHISNLFVTNSGADGIHIVDTGNSVTDWSLLDSWVAISGASAIYMDNAAGWTVRGNHVYGVKQDAIFAKNCWATSIDGNYVEGFGADGNSTWYGIACTVNGVPGATVISNNKVFMFTKEPSSGSFVYIGIPQVNYGTGEVNVEGNVIHGAGSDSDIGLSYQLSGGKALNIISSGNNVDHVHTERAVGQGVKLVEGY